MGERIRAKQSKYIASFSHLLDKDTNTYYTVRVKCPLLSPKVEFKSFNTHEAFITVLNTTVSKITSGVFHFSLYNTVKSSKYISQKASATNILLANQA